MGILKLSYQEELVLKKITMAKNWRMAQMYAILYNPPFYQKEIKLALEYINDLDADHLSFAEWQLTRENLK